MKTLVVENITKTFKISRKQQRIEKTMESYKTAVNGLSFVANEGEIYGLLGPNGAGKTTTLRIISTLIKQDKGDVIIEGLNTKTDTEKVRAKIGFLTSELKLEDFFTPNYLFDYFGKLHNIPDDVLENRKKELFEKFGIEKFAEVKIADLSTGMKQKVSIVISIVHDPDVIIFDEPTNGLDVITAKVVTDFLKELKSQNKTGPDGQDSIVKAINVANGVSEAEVNSQKIQAASIDVVDLSAFKAKIANFDISGNAIYSGKKTMEDPVSGIYVSTTGIGAGDGSLTGKNVTPMQLLPDGSFKLTGKNALFDFNTVTGELSIDATHFTVASKVVATKDDISSQIGARNLIRNSNTLDFEDYVFEGQVTISDLVDANGQSLVDSDGNTIKIKAAYTSIYTGKQIDDMVAEVMN